MGELKNFKYVLSVTFGDYKNTIGGVAKVVAAHQEMFNRNGISYICIFPLNISNRKYIRHNKYWGVIVDGILDRVCSTKGFINYLFDLGSKGIMCECIHIHHLMHIDIKELSQIIRELNSNIYFYIHDYYTICTSTKLICDDGTLCENDFLNCEKCRLCNYYSESVLFQNEFRQFINEFKNRLTFIAPSNACKNWFLKQYAEYCDMVVVVYHQRLEDTYKIPERSGKNIKIGFVGVPIPAKGWNQFKNLYKKYQKASELEFVYFSSIEDSSVDIRRVPVTFQKSLSAMQDALKEERIDYVILWSIWPETYSYTYFESYSAGCCIITNSNSGNIADQVHSMNTGLIVNEKELMTFFDDLDSANKFRNDYIMNQENVCGTLRENDEIVDMSNKKTSMPNHKMTTGHQNDLICSFLKILYKTKLILR